MGKSNIKTKKEETHVMSAAAKAWKNIAPMVKALERNEPSLVQMAKRPKIKPIALKKSAIR